MAKRLCKSFKDRYLSSCQYLIFLLPENDCNPRTAIPRKSPVVYLTVSPRAEVSWFGQVSARHLILNWEMPEDARGKERDWVGLWDTDIERNETLTSTQGA